MLALRIKAYDTKVHGSLGIIPVNKISIYEQRNIEHLLFTRGFFEIESNTLHLFTLDLFA